MNSLPIFKNIINNPKMPDFPIDIDHNVHLINIQRMTVSNSFTSPYTT